MKKVDSITYSKRTEKELSRISDHLNGKWYTVTYYDDRKDCLVYAINIPINEAVNYHPFKVVKIIIRACSRFIIDYLGRVEYK